MGCTVENSCTVGLPELSLLEQSEVLIPKKVSYMKQTILVEEVYEPYAEVRIWSTNF